MKNSVMDTLVEQIGVDVQRGQKPPLGAFLGVAVILLILLLGPGGLVGFQDIGRAWSEGRLWLVLVAFLGGTALSWEVFRYRTAKVSLVNGGVLAALLIAFVVDGMRLPWSEGVDAGIHAGCAGLGGLVSAGFLVVSGWIVGRWSPFGTTRQRFSLILVAGGAAMGSLEMHCGGMSWEHLTIGHLLPAVLVGTASWWWLRSITRRRLSRILPHGGKNLQNLDRLVEP